MLRRILTTFILLSGVQAASAADVCSLPSVAATVPLKPVANSNLLTAPVEINGKPKEFLLAISANPTQISQGAIIDLGLVKSVKYGQRMEYNMSLMAPGGEGGGATSVESLSVPMTDARSGRSADPVAQVDIDAFTIGGATGKGLKFDMSKDKELGLSHPQRMHRSGQAGVLVAWCGGRDADVGAGRQDAGAGDHWRPGDQCRD